MKLCIFLMSLVIRGLFDLPFAAYVEQKNKNFLTPQPIDATFQASYKSFQKIESKFPPATGRIGKTPIIELQ